MRRLLLILVVVGMVPASARAAPSVTISGGPSGTVTERNASFTFSVQNAVAPYTVVCSLDGTAASECMSPREYRDLALGDHLFVVTARETRSGASDSAQRSWSIATMPPLSPPPSAAPTGEPPAATDPSALLSGAQLDLDHDGLADGDDPCPAGARGRASPVPGCTLTDVLARPHVLLTRLVQDARRARISLTRFSALQSAGLRASSLLTRALRLLALGLGRLDDASPCTAAAFARRGLVLTRRAEQGFARDVTTLRRRLVRRQRGPLGGDFEQRDAQLLGASVALQLVKGVSAEVARLRVLLASLCPQRAKRVLTGRIAALDDAGQTARLSGRTIYLGGLRRAGVVAEGVKVRVTGLAVAGGVLATNAVSQGAASFSPGVFAQPCLGLRIAPDQLPIGNVLHEVGGYTEGGMVHLEQATRLGVQGPATPCPDKVGTKTMDYSMALSLKYTRTTGGTTTAVLAQSMDADSFPVALPADVSPSQPATLTAVLSVYGCEPDPFTPANNPNVSPKFICDVKKTLKTTTYTVRVHEPGHYGQVFYDPNVFAIADDDNTSFGTATLMDFLPANGNDFSNAGYVVEGIGFPVMNGQAIKSLSVIPFNGQFAVYNTFGSYAPLDEAFTGPAGGLVKARLNGTRNGHPFWYSLRRDWVTTDATTLCNPISSFFLMPWAAGTTWSVSQGNNTNFTHSGGQKYAFDFDLASITPIHAARGGQVILVKESYTKTSNPNKVKAGLEPFAPANALVILHMDGTESVYYHMIHNGVLPQFGDTVHRGELVAFSDNSGNSTGPHLHFHVVTQLQNVTYPIRFDGFWLQGAQFATCAVPQKDQSFVSTNG